MKLLAQICLRDEPKLLLGLFALSTCFCKPILCQTKRRCGWPQEKIDCCQDPEGLFLVSADRFRGWVGCILVSLFCCYSLVNKGSMVSFPREQKCKVCLPWGFCGVRVWLIAKRLLSGHKRECKMTEVCVGLGVDREERSFASLYSSFFLLIDQTL